MKTWIETVLWTISMLSLCFLLFYGCFLFLYGYNTHKSLADLDSRQKTIEKKIQEQSNLTELEKPEPPKLTDDAEDHVGKTWVKTIIIEGCEYATWKDAHGLEVDLHKGNCHRCWRRMHDLISNVMNEKLANVTNSTKTVIVFPDIDFKEETNNTYKVAL